MSSFLSQSLILTWLVSPGFLLSIAGFLSRASLEGAESRGAGISSDTAPSIGNFLQVLVFSHVTVVSTLQDYSGD